MKTKQIPALLQQRDQPRVQARFNRIAATYECADFFAQTSSERMLERLDYLKIHPKWILDVGCGTGRDLHLLSAHFNQAKLIGVDFSQNMLIQLSSRPGWRARLQDYLFKSHSPRYAVAAKAENLPLAPESMDLIWSNLLLPWVEDIPTLFSDWQNTLSPQGVVMFSSLGPDSLKELRIAFGEQHANHIHNFYDMHDLGDMLLHSGFADPVMDVEWVNIQYENISTLWQDLKACGAVNALPHRPKGLMNRQKWQKILDTLHAQQTEKGIQITLELIQGHAWKGQKQSAKPSENHITQTLKFYPKK